MHAFHKKLSKIDIFAKYYVRHNQVFCVEIILLTAFCVYNGEILVPSVFAYRHRFFVLEKEYQRRRNVVPLIIEFPRNQLAVLDQPLCFCVIVKVHRCSLDDFAAEYSYRLLVEILDR